MADNGIQLRGPDLLVRTGKVFSECSEECSGYDIKTNMRQIPCQPIKKFTLSLIEIN